MKLSALKNTSVRTKLLLLFLLFSILPVLSLALLSYKNTINTIESNEIQYSEQIIEQVSDNINELRRNYDRICYSIKTNAQLIDSIVEMDKHFDVDNYIRIRETLNDILVARRNEIGSLFIYSPETREYRAGNALATAILNYDKSQTFLNTVNANGKTVWGCESESPLDFKNGDFLSVSISLNDPSSDSYGGQVLLLVRESAFEKLYGNDLQGKKGILFVTDRHGRAISHSNKAFLGHEMFKDMTSEALVKDKGYYTEGTGKDRQIIIYSTLDSQKGWKIICTIPYVRILQEASQVRNFTLLLIFTYILACAAAAYLIANRATKPIKDIESEVELATEALLESSIRQMEREKAFVHREQPLIELQTSSKDEFARISHNTAIMMRRLQNLVEEVYKEKLLKREAELKSLQSQIDPHFLYNSLEHIKSLALIEDADGAVNQITALGKLFRFNLAKGSDIVTIAHEIEHVQYFSMFHSNNASVCSGMQIDLSEEWLERVCLRMVLQPLVENAYQHAFEAHSPQNEISIHEADYEGMRCLCVQDNGKGMEEKKLSEVRMHLLSDAFRAGGKGVALANVHQRLQIRFGSSYGLFIESKLNQGTSVYLKLPDCLYEEWVLHHEIADR